MRTLVLFLALLGLTSTLTAKPEDSCVQVTRIKAFIDPRTGQRSVETGWGSGTVVKNEKGTITVLTNKHVAPDKNAIYMVMTNEGYYYPAKFVAAAGTIDLALLKAQEADLPPITVAKDAPVVGADLTQLGYTAAGAMQTRKGPLYDADWTGDEGFKAIAARISSWHGDSGGPLLNAKGELAGVIYGGPKYDQTTALGVRLDEVTRFLADPEKVAKETPKKETPPAPAMPDPAGTRLVPQFPVVGPAVPGFTGSGRNYAPPRSFGPGGSFPGQYQPSR